MAIENKDTGKKPVLHILNSDKTAQPGITRRPVSDAVLENSKLLYSGAGKGLINACNIIRQKVLRKLRDADDKSVGVVSPVVGDGKSLVAANLALSLARQPRSDVVLVELDLHKPSLARTLAIQVEKGCDDFLSDSELGLNSCLVDPGIANLQLLPVRRARHSASELVASNRLPELIQLLRQQNPERVVVFDLPPLFATPDATTVLEMCGCSLLVARDGHTPLDMLNQAAKTMNSYALAGVVLNACRDKETSYYDY